MSDRLAIPISSLLTIYWPFGRAQSLAAVPVGGGAVTAFKSLLGFIPLPLFFGLLAETIDLKRAIFWIYIAGTLLMILLVWLMPPSDGAECVMGLEAAHYLRQYNLYAF